MPFDQKYWSLFPSNCLFLLWVYYISCLLSPSPMYWLSWCLRMEHFPLTAFNRKPVSGVIHWISGTFGGTLPVVCQNFNWNKNYIYTSICKDCIYGQFILELFVLDVCGKVSLQKKCLFAKTSNTSLHLPNLCLHAESINSRICWDMTEQLKQGCNHKQAKFRITFYNS